MNKKKIDNLVWQLVFGKEEEKSSKGGLSSGQNKAYLQLWNLGQESGVLPAYINDLYMARGKNKIPHDFTVPAINVRGMAYDMAKAVFKVANKFKVGALIFEIARSEIGYTNQSPKEYTGVIIGAALIEKFQGPLFIQGDHFQVKKGDKAGEAKTGEIKAIKRLIKNSVEAGFYNIDLDISTLVDYSKLKIYDQQKNNFQVAAQLTEFIRKIEPRGVTISLGGEIGHIGGKNSTEEELRNYMKGYNKTLKKGFVGLSKMAIQTGTHHGGVPLADGSLADVDVDFATLKRLGEVAREYGMGGTVQHGASTLPDKYFKQFTKCEAIEVHLATEFQNIIMDYPSFPKKLLKKMYQWIDSELQEEKKEGWTSEQFHYKLRKKTFGAFKKDFWNLSKEIRVGILKELEKKFSFIFKSLNVQDTKKLVERWVKPVKINK